jgi:dTDP-4-dehydrorhamnose 3,5-epimerase
MEVVKSKKIPEILIIKLPIYKDHRGYFTETFNPTVENLLECKFYQDNQSVSKKNVVRGVHLQWDKPMGKLVRVLRGKGVDIAVDLRKGSRTYSLWHAETLFDDGTQLWVPPGFGHAFLSLEDNTLLAYKCSAVHNEATTLNISPFDPDIDLSEIWDKFSGGSEAIILSDKDNNAGSFAEYDSNPKFMLSKI